MILLVTASRLGQVFPASIKLVDERAGVAVDLFRWRSVEHANAGDGMNDIVNEDMDGRSNWLATLRAALRWIRDALLTVVFCVVAIRMVFWLIMAATGLHWLFGLVATIVYAGAAYWGVFELRSRQLQRFPIRKGVAIAFLTASCAIAVAASISLLLLRAGWAIYDPTPPPNTPQAYGNLVIYFVWVLLDMLPGLQVTDLLSFDPSLEPKNAVAGIPVIAFRAFVLFGLLAALKEWWKGRKDHPRDDPA